MYHQRLHRLRATLPVPFQPGFRLDFAWVIFPVRSLCYYV